MWCFLWTHWPLTAYSCEPLHQTHVIYGSILIISQSCEIALEIIRVLMDETVIDRRISYVFCVVAAGGPRQSRSCVLHG